MLDVGGQEDDHARQQGASRADQVAAARSLGRGQALEGDDEADCGYQVAQLGPGWCHWSSSRRTDLSSAFLGRENMINIRSVTTNPPTMLIDAKITATRPRMRIGVDCALPATRIAPIKITPWMALAPDISGVCKVEDTLEITSIP